MTAEDLIARLKLVPHPEGGWYRQTWVADVPADGPEGMRPSGTCIYFLLQAGESSRWHRVDATEIWHHYAGAPLIVSTSATTEGPSGDNLLGSDILAGESPQVIVPAGYWQSARSTGAWTLVGCTVSPGFQFKGFELAAPGFDIPAGSIGQ